ncbi:MAG: hypothetical protein HQL29_04445 [Candidatus Omnitrophica bacterium]|nr:hypothetical protein [Candidatus Omnitrophota bacterium]
MGLLAKIKGWLCSNTNKVHSRNTNTHSSDAALPSNEFEGISTWKSRNALFLKTVAVVVSVLFAHEQIGWTEDGGKPVWAFAKQNNFDTTNTQLFKNIEVPNDLGKKSSVITNGTGETILNIQDAHSSLAAQHSIVGLIDSLVKNYNLDLIAVEGSTGYVDTSLLKTFPDEGIRNTTANKLMEDGLMSAAEFYQITNDEKEVEIYGVEDQELYRENIKSFRDVAGNMSERLASTGALIAQLDLLAKAMYPGELYTLEENARKHRDSSLSFSDYWTYVDAVSTNLKIDISSYTEIPKLLESIKLEKEINFNEANNERKQLIKELTDMLEARELETLVSKSVLFKQEKISQADYHLYLTELASDKGINNEGYSNLIKYARYVSLYENVDVFRLYSEIESVEEAIASSLVRSKDENKLRHIEKVVRLIDMLYTMEMANDDYYKVKSQYKAYNSAEVAGFIREMSAKYNVPIKSGYDLGLVFGDVEEALKFYEDAEARDRALFNNTLRRMRQEGKQVAALVTGGYHTEGLKKMLQENKLSYMVIAPKFKDGQERPYIAVLTNNKTPYMELVKSGSHKLAVWAFFDDSTLDFDKPTILFEKLLESNPDRAFELLRRDDWKNIWIVKYEERYNFLKHKNQEDMTAKITPQQIREFLETVEVKKSGPDMLIGFDGETAAITGKKGRRVFATDSATVNTVATLVGDPEVLVGVKGQEVVTTPVREMVPDAENVNNMVIEIAKRLQKPFNEGRTIENDAIKTQLRRVGVDDTDDNVIRVLAKLEENKTEEKQEVIVPKVEEPKTMTSAETVEIPVKVQVPSESEKEAKKPAEVSSKSKPAVVVSAQVKDRRTGAVSMQMALGIFGIIMLLFEGFQKLVEYAQIKFKQALADYRVHVTQKMNTNSAYLQSVFVAAIQRADTFHVAGAEGQFAKGLEYYTRKLSGKLIKDINTQISSLKSPTKRAEMENLRNIVAAIKNTDALKKHFDDESYRNAVVNFIDRMDILKQYGTPVHEIASMLKPAQYKRIFLNMDRDVLIERLENLKSLRIEVDFKTLSYKPETLIKRAVVLNMLGLPINRSNIQKSSVTGLIKTAIDDPIYAYQNPVIKEKKRKTAKRGFIQKLDKYLFIPIANNLREFKRLVPQSIRAYFEKMPGYNKKSQVELPAKELAAEKLALLQSSFQVESAADYFADRIDDLTSLTSDERSKIKKEFRETLAQLPGKAAEYFNKKMADVSENTTEKELKERVEVLRNEIEAKVEINKLFKLIAILGNSEAVDSILQAIVAKMQDIPVQSDFYQKAEARVKYIMQMRKESIMAISKQNEIAERHTNFSERTPFLKSHTAVPLKVALACLAVIVAGGAYAGVGNAIGNFDNNATVDGLGFTISNGGSSQGMLNPIIVYENMTPDASTNGVQ